MLEHYFSRPSTLNRLRSGPIGSDVDDLATALQQQGYAWDSIRNYLRGCDQFARWLSQHGYAPSEVSQTLVNRYIHGGLGQMTQDTYGKPYLHTFLAFINS
jgi:integrase/recombinase XerD